MRNLVIQSIVFMSLIFILGFSISKFLDGNTITASLVIAFASVGVSLVVSTILNGISYLIAKLL